MTLKRVRRFAMALAFAVWIYTFTVLHGAEGAFRAGTPTGALPEGLVLLLGLTLIASIGVVITGGMRLPVWPWLAMLSALCVVLVTFEARYLTLKAELRVAIAQLLKRIDAASVSKPDISRLFRPVSAGTALRECASGAVHILFFIAAPALLLAAGIYGWYYGPRTMFIPEPPRAA